MKRNTKSVKRVGSSLTKPVINLVLVFLVLVFSEVKNPLRVMDYKSGILFLITMIALGSSLLDIYNKKTGRDTEESFVSKVVDTSIVIYVALLFVTIITTFFFSVTYVSGESMTPTLKDGEQLKVTYIYEIDRFDIVIIDKENDDMLVKRVIGLPGDVLELEGDNLYVNGTLVECNFETKGVTTLVRRVVTVPEGMYYVLGDNRGNSLDSRSFGFTKRSEIVAEVMFK